MKNEAKGWDYMVLALLAFGGIGLEVPLVLGLEPLIYGAGLGEWTVLQNIIHWIVTCVVWGTVSGLLIGKAKKEYDFDIFEKQSSMRGWQWTVTGICIVISLIISYYDWNGSKVVKEFYSNGWLKFIFQYIYYIFETGLVTLILIFGQKACEKWFHKENIPYGGIIAAITWGLGHIMTKGSLSAGIICAVSGLAFGSVYLLTNRDIRKTFPAVFIMFVL